MAAAWILAAPAGASAGEWDRLLAPESACPGQTNVSQSPAAHAEAMVCLHNYARTQSGLRPLGPVKKLRMSATQKARDIKRCQQFSHTACGRDPFHWIERVGFLRGSSGAGENLALGSGAAASPRAIVASWLDSDLHRPVILDSRFEQIGIGVVSASFHGYPGVRIWVAHLGYRR